MEKKKKCSCYGYEEEEEEENAGPTSFTCKHTCPYCGNVYDCADPVYRECDSLTEARSKGFNCIYPDYCGCPNEILAIGESHPYLVWGIVEFQDED